MKTLRIDIETYSSIDLTKSGVYKYVEAPDFEILLFAYKADNDKVRIVDLAQGGQIPAEVLYALTDPSVKKTAFNAAFERVCIGRYITHSTLDPLGWECTLVKGALLGLPLSLAAVGEVLNITNKKDKAGDALIRYFSIPCKPSKANGMRTRNMPSDNPEKWQAFKDYCVRDVEAESEIGDRLAWFNIPQREQALYILDQMINDRGVRLDLKLIRNAINMDSMYKESLMKEAIMVSGLDNPNSTSQLKEWLSEAMNESVNTLRKSDLPDLLKKSVSPFVTRMLGIRSELSKTSVKKYVAMTRCVCEDERARGLFQFYGANRTGRWAGRLLQPHNLPRVTYDKKSVGLTYSRDLCLSGEYDELYMMFSSVSDALSQLLRTAFIPSQGCRFIVADFSAIEARVIAWLAGEKWRLNVFNNNGDIYIASAANMFNIPVEKIITAIANGEKWADEIRQRGKVAELALGFQGGKNALIAMDSKKVLKPSELQPIVDAWREASPNIVQLWKDAQNAAVEAIETGNTCSIGKGVSYYMDHGVLFASLPSGRVLAYQQPGVLTKQMIKIRLLADTRNADKGSLRYVPLDTAHQLFSNGMAEAAGEPYTTKSPYYRGMIQETNKWGIIDTYGGSLVENLVQAIARDCLTVSLMRLHKSGFNIVMHVHDEVVLDVPMGKSNLDEVCAIMSEPIPWANGLPLGAAGFEGKFYKK